MFSTTHERLCYHYHYHLQRHLEVVSGGGAPTPAGTSVFTKHNWDMGMGYLWLNGWGIYHLMGGAFMAQWVGHLHLNGWAFMA